MLRRLTIITLIANCCIVLNAQSLAETDTIVTQKKNIFKRVIEYFDKSNETDPNKKFDFSVIGGPHYSSDSKLGLGLVASGLFRLDRSDMELSPSNVSIYSDVTTTGSYVLGVSGNIIFPKMKYRIDSDVFFANRPGRYWGVGYDYGRLDDNYTEFDNQQIFLKFDFLKKIWSQTYFGVTLNYRNAKGKSFDDISYLHGENPSADAVGGGLILSYDSRDFIPNPYSGIYAKVEQVFYPKVLGSTANMNKTEFIFRYYRQVWKGGIMAFDLQGTFNNGDVPWNLVALMGGSYQMRGYYAGQYRDKKLVQSQIELRQKVYRRSGVVVWAGAGNVFPSFSDFEWDHTLPSFGFGYRWEFKKRVNVRLDYGIGKGQTGFYFNINEAF